MHLGSTDFVQCDCLSTSCNCCLYWKPVSCHTPLWGQTSTAAPVLFSPSPSFSCSRAQDAITPQQILQIIPDGQQLMVNVPPQLSNVKRCLFLSVNFIPPFTLSLYYKFCIPGALVTVRVLFSSMQIGLSALLILMKAAILVIGWKLCDSLPHSQGALVVSTWLNSQPWHIHCLL